MSKPTPTHTPPEEVVLRRMLGTKPAPHKAPKPAMKKKPKPAK